MSGYAGFASGVWLKRNWLQHLLMSETATNRLATVARLVTATAALLAGAISLWFARYGRSVHPASRPTLPQIAFAVIAVMLLAVALTLPRRLALGLLSAIATYAFFLGLFSVTLYGMLLIATSGLAATALGLTLVAVPREHCVRGLISAASGGVLGLAAVVLLILAST